MAECKCNKCGHEWESRQGDENPPKTCPKCKSYNWNKEVKKEK